MSLESPEKPKKIQEAPDPEKELEKRLLNTVLEVAGDDENMIKEGIIKALRGENDKARRTYLWNILSKAAKEKIRHARKKAGV